MSIDSCSMRSYFLQRRHFRRIMDPMTLSMSHKKRGCGLDNLNWTAYVLVQTSNKKEKPEDVISILVQDT